MLHLIFRRLQTTQEFGTRRRFFAGPGLSPDVVPWVTGETPGSEETDEGDGLVEKGSLMAGEECCLCRLYKVMLTLTLLFLSRLGLSGKIALESP